MLCWKRDTAAAVSAEAAADARKTAAAVLVLPRGRPHGQRCCHAHAPKSRAVSSNSVDFKGQNQSHRQRHSSSTIYNCAIYTPKNCSNGKKVSFFIVNWISHLQREIVDSLNWRRLLQCLKLIGSTFLIKVKIYDFMLSASIHYICLQRFFFHTSLLCLDFFKKKYVYILFFSPLLRTFSLEYYRYLSNWVIPFFALMLCLLTYSLHYIMSFVGPFAD